MTVQSLTQDDRANARYLLGYSMITSNFDPRTYLPAIPAGLQDGSAVFENSVRSILDDRSYALVTALIAQIFEYRVEIVNASKTLLADEIVGAVKLSKKRMDLMWAEDYRNCQQLASLLMVRIYWHPAMASGGFGTLVTKGG